MAGVKKEEVEGPRLEIDELRLDEEWVGQPKLYFTWARKQADAVRCVDQAKSALDVTRADLDADIRQNPQAYGVAKITEKVIENIILGNDGYQSAVAAVVKAKHESAILAAVVSALEHRKRALECLVTLHGQNYFSTPRADESNREVMADVEKKSARDKGKPKHR